MPQITINLPEDLYNDLMEIEKGKRSELISHILSNQLDTITLATEEDKINAIHGFIMELFRKYFIKNYKDEIINEVNKELKRLRKGDDDIHKMYLNIIKEVRVLFNKDSNELFDSIKNDIDDYIKENYTFNDED